MSSTLNPVGLARDERHGYYWQGRGPIPSVTTILSTYDKSGPLVGWAKREVSNAAVRNLDTLATMLKASGPEAAARWLGTIPGYQRDTAADIGSTVHEIADAISQGQTVPIADEVAPFVAAYQHWLTDWSPKFLASEEMVCSLRYGYAGTLDAIVEMEGTRWLVDYKTGRNVYGETALQLAAYARADFIGQPGNPHKLRIPAVSKYAVLHLRPEGYALVEYAVGEETFKTFLALRDVYRWREGEAQRIMAEPVTGPDGWYDTPSGREARAAWGSLHAVAKGVTRDV